ncbi:MAG: MarP family serine protease [Actinomycetota bacterium]|nr:MarP family serine protease [Actinomycetota bacterium]
MSTADWIVLGVVVLFGLYGLSKGLVRGALSLAGFALGAYVGARIAPTFLADGSPYAPLVALGGAVLGGTLLSSLAEFLGVTLRSTMGMVPGLRALDSVAGLLLGAAAGLVLSWAVGAVLLYLPGQSELRRSVQDSEILSRINQEFPPERLLETLERVDPLGVLVGPPAAVPPPKAAIARDSDVTVAAGSVVRVSGIACGLGVEGSGWIARAGLVVTNAHVVAGIDRPSVDRQDGRSLSSTVVVFDSKNDLAVLSVPGLGGRPLRLAEPARGAAVALVGYPENGPLTLTPGRLGDTGDFVSRDAYGRKPVRKSVTAIRGVVRPGNSGGPGIDAQGRVRTTIFARRTGERGGFGIPPARVREALARSQNGMPGLATDCAG